MKPALYFITVVTKDLNNAIKLYQEGLGLPLTAKGPGNEEPVYAKFDLQHGLSLVLVTEQQFQEFTHIDTRGSRSSQVIFSLPKASRKEVKAAYEQAIQLGGKSLIVPADREIGYSASLLDLDGNVIEIILDEELPEIILAE